MYNDIQCITVNGHQLTKTYHVLRETQICCSRCQRLESFATQFSFLLSSSLLSSPSFLPSFPSGASPRFTLPYSYSTNKKCQTSHKSSSNLIHFCLHCYLAVLSLSLLSFQILTHCWSKHTNKSLKLKEFEAQEHFLLLQLKSQPWNFLLLPSK